MKIFLDIETVPDEAAIELLNSMYAKIEPVPDISEIKADGRLKDEEAIRLDKEKKLEVFKIKFEEKYTEMFSSFALSPLTGKIICYSALVMEKGIIIKDDTFCNENEIAVLSRLNKIAEEAAGRNFSATFDQVIGFNSKSFDIPFLIVRSAINRLNSPFLLTSKYDLNHHFDVRSALTNFNDRMQGTLAQWCLAFGIEYDDSVTGRDIFALMKTGQKEVIQAKCRQDRDVTIQLYNSIERYYR